MGPRGFGDDSLGVLVAVIIPGVCLLCWLFNAYQLGWFRKKKGGAVPSRLAKWLLLIGCILLAILADLLRRFVG